MDFLLNLLIILIGVIINDELFSVIVDIFRIFYYNRHLLY